MKIALICSGNPEDKTIWSGTPFHIYNNIKKYADVDYYFFKETLFGKVYCLWYKILSRLSGKSYIGTFHSRIGRIAARQIDRKLSSENYDAILSLGCSYAVAYLKNKTPVIYLSDAVFSDMLDYYIFNISDKTKKEGNIIEKRALEKSEKIIFATKWPSESAEKVYGADKSKIEVVHLGASVSEEIHCRSENLSQVECINLLLIGVDWDRKGCQTAVDCLNYLNDNSEYKFKLHIIGCKPNYELNNENVILHGFINKNSPEGNERFNKILSECDLFILPTKAECAGIAFAEATAYCLPAFTYDTGGVSDMVIDGENGYCLPMTSKGSDFAEKILEVIAEDGKIDYMRSRAEYLYKNDYNWDICSRKIINVIKSALKKNGAD